MPITRMPSWNKWLVLAACLCSGPAIAQQAAPARPGGQPVPPAGSASTMQAVVTEEGDSDPLIDALTCRSSNAALPGLLGRLRRERPSDFVQTDRQYSAPAMDLYRLQYPIRAWGHDSDAIVITANRVLMVVPGPLESATKRLEDSLAASAAAPLSGALDDQHALVVYEEQRPGLQQQVLIGCEYRLEGLSLIDEPAETWRRPVVPVVPVESGAPAVIGSQGTATAP